MSERTIRDLSGPKGVVIARIDGESALQRWVIATSHAEPKFYELDVRGRVALRFAFGRDLAGGVMAVDHDGNCWWLIGGDAALRTVELPCEGDVLPIVGREQVGRERLTAALLHLLAAGERVAGSWVEPDGKIVEVGGGAPTGPWRGIPPRAVGRYSRALVATAAPSSRSTTGGPRIRAPSAAASASASSRRASRSSRRRAARSSSSRPTGGPAATSRTFSPSRS